jgi:hypothetical protein
MWKQSNFQLCHVSMTETTTIEITDAQRAELEERKRHEREPIRDVLGRVLADDEPEAPDAEIQEQLDRIEAAAKEATNAAQNAEQAIEEATQ